MEGKQAVRALPVEGIVFPTTERGDRSSTITGREVFKAAIASVDPKEAVAVANEKNWRFGYAKHVVKHVELAAKSSEDALKIAQAGVDYMYCHFEFVRNGETVNLEEAMQKFTGTFETGVIKGKREGGAKGELQVPYKGKVLKGKELVDVIDQWAQYGTIEPACASALKACVLHPEWLDLSDKYFVLLGAGSAMGPFLVLAALGANIIAVDLDRPHIWKRLIGLVEDSSATLTFPLKRPQSELSSDALYENAGCNLFTHAPEIKNWVSELYPGAALMVGSYAYLDGELHVRVALAMDMVARGAMESRGNTAIAFLNTPTQAFVVPEEARQASVTAYNEYSLFNLATLPLRLVGGKRFLVRSYSRPPVTGDDGKERVIVDSLVTAQGPNYALAKTLQHWRAVLARSSGNLVSSNVAPSTATVSVVHNRQFAWAYAGMHYFKPMEVFMQDTSNAVMAALLINDVCNEKSLANPKNALEHPWDIFQQGAFHGGVWRMAYKMNSVGETAALLCFFDKGKPAILLAIVVALLAMFYRSA